MCYSITCIMSTDKKTGQFSEKQKKTDDSKVKLADPW